MTKVCNHTSVGMLVYQADKLLLIERKDGFGFAPPAGHVDEGEEYQTAAIRELKEEVGLVAKEIKLIIEAKKDNHCKRPDGLWHYWKIYQIETAGELKRSRRETKQAGWYDKSQLLELAAKTESYLRKEITWENWVKAPGLEPVWYEWLKELKII